MPVVQKQISPDDESAAHADAAARLAAAEARIASTEAKLLDAEEMLHDSLQSSLSWLWESDEQLCFTRIIGSNEQILGTSAESLIGSTVEDFTRAPNDPQV